MTNFNYNFKNIKYMSFDLYDTLILRNLSKPSLVFDFVEIIYNKQNNANIKFTEKRKEAEIIARRKDKEEINIDDIYIELLNDFEKNICEKLKKIEKFVEENICIKNNNSLVNELFDYAKRNNIKIIITSDMYLDKESIKKIITNCKINNVYKIYLSSEINKTKRNKSLFKYILKDLNITSKEIIHIGDNKKSDYINSRKIGIKSILVVNKSYVKYKNNKKMNQSLYYNLLESFINNNIESKSYFYDFGFECFGPILYGIVKWLFKETKKDDIKKIYFLSRDGYVIKKAFELFEESNNYDSFYFYGSRRALIVPSISEIKGTNELFDIMNLPKKIQLKEFLKKVGLDDINVDYLIKKYNLSYYEYYKISDMKSQSSFQLFLKELYPIIIENSINEKEMAINYFKKMQFNNRVGIVDIGWNGNMQNAINKIIHSKENKIVGYYVGLNPNNQNYRNNIMHGFLFDNENNVDLYKKVYSFMAIFETLFLAQHGSVKKYTSSSNSVDFYEYEYENLETKNQIQELQDGALDFIKCIINNKLYDFIDFDPEELMTNLLKFALNPKLIDANKFGNLLFNENGIKKIAYHENMLYYIFHPKQFITDYKKSYWKIGFMKSIFKINISYDKIYFFLKKIYNR